MRSALFTLALACSLPSLALAQSTADDARARTHFMAARAAFDSGEFAHAAEEFLEAYSLSPRPELLMNAATAWERADHPEEALVALETYRRTTDEATRDPSTDTRIDALRARLAERAPPPPEDTPPPEQTPAQPATSARTDDGLLVSGLVVASVGGAALAGSLITGLLAEDRYQQLTAACAQGTCAQSTIDEGAGLATASTVLFFGGLALAATGTVLAILGATAPGPGTPSVAVVATPELAMLAVGGAL